MRAFGWSSAVVVVATTDPHNHHHHITTTDDDSLAQESTLEEMVTYLVEPAPPGADDKRVHKYPYMACEVKFQKNKTEETLSLSLPCG